jgi:hypothetical protein
VNEKILNEVNQIHNFISSFGSGTVINYRYCFGSGSDFLTSYGSDSGSAIQKVTVPVQQHYKTLSLSSQKYGFGIRDPKKTYSGSRIQGSKRHGVKKAPDPDPQHCRYDRAKTRYSFPLSGTGINLADLMGS